METKEATVHMLPNTEGAIISNGSRLFMQGNEFYNPYAGTFTANHLYFTTDEDAEEGEWCIDIVPHGNLVVNIAYQKDKRPYKQLKIIATIDPKLFTLIERADSVTNPCPQPLPQASQDFIEEYCKAGGIDKVLVEMVERFGCTEGEKCPAFTGESSNGVKCKGEVITYHKSLTDSNNCIIIHPVEEKMYSKDEVAELIKKHSEHIYKGYYVFKNDLECILDLDKKWIKENL